MRAYLTVGMLLIFTAAILLRARAANGIGLDPLLVPASLAAAILLSRELDRS